MKRGAKSARLKNLKKDNLKKSPLYFHEKKNTTGILVGHPCNELGGPSLWERTQVWLWMSIMGEGGVQSLQLQLPMTEIMEAKHCHTC